MVVLLFDTYEKEPAFLLYMCHAIERLITSISYNKYSQKIIKKLKFESNFCWFSEDIFGKIPVQISIIFCTQKTERQKFIDFGQNILWALCEWNAMINTLKYTK